MKPLILFAPGAGQPSSSDWMQRWAGLLGTLGEVVTLDYPYALAGRKRPDRLPVLLAAHQEALQAAKDAHPGRPVVLAGKSMGSRVGCHLALEQPVHALVCLGYPLTSMGKRDKLRDEVLVALKTPVLFVQGTRDRLCPLDLLDEVRMRMEAPNALHVVPTGDHSLKITKTHTKTTSRTQEDEDHAALQAIAGFLWERLPE